MIPGPVDGGPSHCNIKIILSSDTPRYSSVSLFRRLARMPIYQCELLLILSFLFTSASAALINVTVDDEAADPSSGSKISYGSGGAFGPKCSRCAAQPDAGQAYKGSWHDATPDSLVTTPQNATFRFTGKHEGFADITWQ